MDDTYVVSFSYTADRGVYAVRRSDDVAVADAVTAHVATEQPSALRALFDNSLSLYDGGTIAGMNAARRDVTDRDAYEAHRRLVASVQRTSISRSFSEGYVAGFSAVAYGVIA